MSRLELYRALCRMMIGYARVSTEDQNVNLQVDALERAGCERIFTDTGFSGSLTSRPALDKALKLVRKGDTLVVWRLDRLGRSLSHLISLVSALHDTGAAVKSLTDAIDTSTAGGMLQFHVLGALAQFERSLISERTKAGMAACQARGVTLGRPGKLTDDEIAKAAKNPKGLPLKMLANELRVSISTVRRYRKLSGL